MNLSKEQARAHLDKNPIWLRAEKVAEEALKLGQGVPDFPEPEAAAMTIMCYAVAIALAKTVPDQPRAAAWRKLEIGVNIVGDQVAGIVPSAWILLVEGES